MFAKMLKPSADGKATISRICRPWPKPRVLPNFTVVRPVFFLLPEVPDFVRIPDLHDFRTLPDGMPKDKTSWSRNLRYLIRQMEFRQEFAIATVQRGELNYQPWVASAERDEIPPEALATMMREILLTENDDPRNRVGAQEALKSWVTKFEDLAGIFVFQTDNNKMPINLTEMRGMSMSDRYATLYRRQFQGFTHG